MYHTTFSPQAMVHVVGNYGANGQFMPLQNHPFYINSPNHVNQFHQISRNVSNYNRNRMSGSYASDLYLMDAENSPNRSMFNVHNKFPSSNWQRQISSPSSNASLSPSVSHMNYRSNILRKNQSWNNINKNTKKNSYQDLTSLNETCNSSDSSLGSRSPTPNNYFKDANQTESSDDRESVHSLSDQSFKSARNNSNCTIRGGLVSSSSSQSLYSNQRNVYNYQDNISRSQIHHNYQNKRRYQNTRNSPPRTHRNRKFPGALVLGNYIYPQLYYSAPDRFLHKAHLIEVKEKPKNLLNNSTYDKLSKAIWDKFEQNQQTEVTFCNKINLWKYLLIFIRSKFPQYGLFMVGSTLNGFGSNSSDIDMCLLLRNAEMDQKNEAIFRLEQILRCLKKCEFIEQLELIQAKVPILKFHNSTFNLDIDLNCNNAVGIRNTHLLYCYSRIDWRVRPLALVIKMWAQSQDINDAKNMTISSYSIALMVIHFLQCGVNPIILPCLHKIFQGKFDPLSDVHTIDVHEELNIPNNIFQCRNQQSLGELLIEFFKYYDKFDYDQYAISIRLAKKIPIEECRLVRTYKNDPHQWKYLCIEEPFDFTNTARSVYDPTVFAKIKDIFKETYKRLKKTRNLASIFIKLDNNKK